MTSWLRITLITVVAYVIFLVFTIPASRAYPIVVDQFGKITLGSAGDLKLYELSGSIWSGRAAVATLGDLRMEPVTWRVHLLPLLVGKVAVTMTAESGDNHVTGTATLSMLGKQQLTLDYASAHFETLPPIFRSFGNDMTEIMLGGKVSTTAASFTFENGALAGADAEVRWMDGTLQMLRPFNQGPFKIGNFNLRLSEAADGVVLMFKDLSMDENPNAVSGSGQVSLGPDGSYQVTASLLPNPSAHRQIQQALSMLGTPQSDGHYLIEERGSLAPPAPTPPPESAQPEPGA